jgi:GDP-L-fucose synthase
MDKKSVILVTGASGMVGSNLVRTLSDLGHRHVLAPTRTELELGDAAQVDLYFRKHRPNHVFMIASRVGGIAANMNDPVGFLHENAVMYCNLFAACHKYGTDKNVFLGSSCIYPRLCPQPMKEEHLLSGPLEPTNEGYALAKIVGLKLAQYYHSQYGLLTICPMVSNIYGTGDHFELDRSHVLSALVKRFVDAQHQSLDEVALWGTGTARREFIHVNDVINGLLFLMEHFDSPQIINLGSGTDVSIRELAQFVSSAVGYEGRIVWDTSKPDGMPRKLMDNSKLSGLGFVPQVSLAEGIEATIQEYQKMQGRLAA